MNREMAYSYTLYNSIDEVDSNEWTQLCAAASELAMDPRFIRAVERSMSDCAKFWHVVFRDETQRPIAAACLYFYLFDSTLALSGWARKAAGWLRRVFPRSTQYKLMICGLPVAIGQNNLSIAEEADAAAVLKLLDEILQSIARRERADAIAFREFDEWECKRLEPLGDLGYRRFASLPMNHARTDYCDFDEFCERVKSKRRYSIKQSRKKFAKSGLRVVHRNGHQGIDRLYTDEVHRLHEAVANGKPTFERMPAEFFRQLAIQMPDEAAFTFVENEDRVVAVAASICTRSAYHSLFIGFDYELNPTCDLYFNLFYNALDYALRQNVSDIVLGQTTDTVKMEKLGAYQQPRFTYVKSLHWFVSYLLRHSEFESSPPQTNP